MVKLIITNKYVKHDIRKTIANRLGFNYLSEIHYDGDGLSFNEMIESIKEEEETVIITADTRLLLLSPQFFELNDIYLYEEGLVKSIQECTKRKLRNGHNLMKLYHAGEFGIL